MIVGRDALEDRAGIEVLIQEIQPAPWESGD